MKTNISILSSMPNLWSSPFKPMGKTCFCSIVHKGAVWKSLQRWIENEVLEMADQIGIAVDEKGDRKW